MFEVVFKTKYEVQTVQLQHFVLQIPIPILIPIPGRKDGGETGGREREGTLDFSLPSGSMKIV